MAKILDLSNPRVEQAFLECLDSHLKLNGIQGKGIVDLVLSAIKDQNEQQPSSAQAEAYIQEDLPNRTIPKKKPSID